MKSGNARCLESEVHDALAKSPYLTRKRVDCVAQDGRVVLRGEVGTYFQKQMATEVLRQVEGIDEIENHLEVIWR